MTTIVYETLKVVLRVALAIYFSRIDVEGEDDVPPGPIVLAATHPNAFIDVALVGTRLRRRVKFVAKAGLFKNPLASLFLKSLGAVPVERRKDREGAALEEQAQAKNAASLGECEAAVASGGAVLIFPEGTSEQLPKLLPLKTGVARIALGAEKKNAGVNIVPVAVSYDDPQSFRSHARVRFLQPIPVAPFLEMSAKDEAGAVRALTGAVRDALEPRVVHVDDESLAPIVSVIDSIYGGHVAATQGAGSRLGAAPAIAQAVNAFQKSSPERVARVKALIEGYLAALKAAGLEDKDVRPLGKPVTPGLIVAVIAGLPFMIWGIVNHYLPYQLPRLVTRAFVRDETFFSTVKLVTGTFVFLALYGVEGFFAVRELGWEIGLPLTLSVPISGIIALEEIEALRAWSRRRERKSRRVATAPEKLRELEKLREGVVVELDRARAEFLLAQAAPAEEGLL